MRFYGSYRPEDVEFLLTPISVPEQHDPNQKEALIQSGKRHYSEMLTPEGPLSAEYLALFNQARERNSERMARDCLTLATEISRVKQEDIALVSLARAGTPVGVILKHILERGLKRQCSHYSISIIRDRGIDENALTHVRAKHSDESIAFIDGWTGKGVINRELQTTMGIYNRAHSSRVNPDLYVLSDLCGVAHFSASYSDYLIPSAILNATISGLVSRSILNDTISEDQFHGCVFFESLREFDVSVAFAEDIVERALNQLRRGHSVQPHNPSGLKRKIADSSKDFMASTLHAHGIKDVNLVKPGIGEATRVLLRRVPELLILKDFENADVAHMIQLANSRGTPIELEPNLPYQAVSIIKRITDAH